MDLERRVLHIVPALFGVDGGVTGGAERFAYELARHMASIVPSTLLSFGREAREELAGDLRVRVLPKPLYVCGQRTNPIHLGLVMQVARASITHCHQQHVLSSSVAALTGKFLGKKVFVSDLGGGGWDISGYVSTDRWYNGHLHLSEYSRHAAGHDRWNRAHVIFGGVDTSKYSPVTSATRSKTVLFVGRLLPHKGVNYLIESLPTGLQLRIIGKPYDRSYVAELQRMAVGRDVVFDTECDDEELVNAYRSALCIVLPSVYRDMYGKETAVPELLGQTLLEGMACGVPAICANVASMPEIVLDGVTGFIVPPNNSKALGEKLVWLRDHPGEAEAMGVRGRKLVLEKFTWPQVVQRCLHIYQQ